MALRNHHHRHRGVVPLSVTPLLFVSFPLFYRYAAPLSSSWSIAGTGGASLSAPSIIERPSWLFGGSGRPIGIRHQPNGQQQFDSASTKFSISAGQLAAGLVATMTDDFYCHRCRRHPVPMNLTR